MERDMQMGGVTARAAERWAKDHGSSVRRGFEVLEAGLKYEKARREGEPFLFGYEPPIWFVASALVRNSPVDARMREVVRARTGMDWEAFAVAMRRACGFEEAVGELLIVGANRSGKTDWAAKRFCRRLVGEGERVFVVGAQTRETSRRTQQERVWHYLPSELRKRNGAREAVFYLNYKMQTGFTFNKVTLENRSSLSFVTYEQDVNAIMEGPAFDEGWLDEEFGKEWLDGLRFRLASKRGALIATFTPVSGWTPVVQDFLEGMVVTRWTTGYLLPKDGGAALPWAQLGLSEDEWGTLSRWYAGGMKGDCAVPESRPEDCFGWLRDGGAFNEPENVAVGRVFERVPRVARSRNGEAAIVWFLGRDNPYGSPGRVIDVALGGVNAEEMVKRRVYGLAKRTRGSRFPGFDAGVNVVDDARVPAVLARTMVVDPAPERNWFFLWMGVDEDGNVWVYREWPGSYEIPGVGVPGAWAVASSRRGGVNDGDRGEGQEKFGFSLLRYKAEWARLEEWSDFTGTGASAEEIRAWRRRHGTREPLRRRVIDARASSQSKITLGEDRTLFDFCQELDELFEQASGKRIGAGEELINGLLNPARGGARLYVARSCRNTIFALQHLTGADGQKGACKEPIDCLRYGLESGMLADRPDVERDGAFVGEREDGDGDFVEMDWGD